ncbi:MAG: hypothetical protein DYG94_14330 [Leptolyngbya sp. PLA3]|nr:MAG: hypothetical protein EDM82_13340 [Cyanobacteria bacterium CYA]MCE7969905.1 hypothetical protein [Leptolyngbya sp. PL-A3]
MNVSMILAGLTALAGWTLPLAAAQPATSVPAVGTAPGQMERSTITQLLRPVTVEFSEHRLADVMDYIATVTGADMEIHWRDDHNVIGLDPESTITLRARNVSALALLERVLEQAADELSEPGSNTWQFTEGGRFEVGPKERLNAHRRIEMYDINDLLFEVPDFTNAPQFDLNSAFQNSGGGRGGGGGGGGRSPFQQTGQGQQNQIDTPSREELAENLIHLITSLVETDQWQENGGEAGSIRFFQGHLIINAPDYMHRGVNGYRWWPSRLTARYGSADERRGVTLTSNEIRKLRRDSELVDPRKPTPPARGGQAGGQHEGTPSSESKTPPGDD